MKIYSTQPDGNEAADLEPAHYFNLAIQRIDKSSEQMQTSEKPIQVMLVHIDILLLLSKKYPQMANLRLEQNRIRFWKESFEKWYERCAPKIPVAYRQGIKESADSLFVDLSQYGH